MSTIEDFENAPVGAIARKGEDMYCRTGDPDDVPWVRLEGRDVRWYRSSELADEGFTLDRTAPTSAREALALAWELAHPVNGGDVIPKSLTCLQNNGECIETKSLPANWTPAFPESVRTLDPLREPLSDWLDAPAVLAWSKLDDLRAEKVWTEVDAGEYRSPDGETVPWTDLENVTPLYPKETNE